jgi:SUKH-4 immunity protein
MHPGHVWMEGQVAYDPGALGQVGAAVRGLLESHSIPVRFFSYFRADGTVKTIRDGSGRAFVQFGYTRDDRYICLAGDDLTVVEVRPRDNSITSLAGSGLDQFLSIMAVCEDRYPYYTDQDELETLIEAANSLERELRAIDPEVLGPDSYWSVFLIDVQMGDYAEVSEDE